MSFEQIVFLLFGALTVGAGIGLGLSRNVVYSVFLLFVILFGMAALYVFAAAPFLAVSQVIIYVGGILILLLFGVMLTHKVRALKPRTGIVNLLPGLSVAVLLGAALIWMIQSVDWGNQPWVAPEREITGQEDIESLGILTVTRFLLPFEAVSILLLVALMGAAYISRKTRFIKKEASK